MDKKRIENLQTAFRALDQATEAAEKFGGGVTTPNGMIAFNKAIDKYIHKEVWNGAMMKVMPSPQGALDITIRQDAYDFILTTIRVSRKEDDEYTGEPYDIAVAHYGPFVVNEDASIDYGGNVAYHHSKDWHKDEHHFSHMFAKNWVCASLESYLEALAHSAKMQGVQSLIINVDIFTTK